LGTRGGNGATARSALTSFVGRHAELARLRALLSDRRLVTITGPGGAGKTRLAEELVATLTRSLDGGAAFAYLAAAHTPVEVGEVVAAAVGLRNRGPRAVGAELIDYIGDQRLLLVLDNCEHLATASAELAAELLSACPGIIIVATGRQPLHVAGEQLFPIGGLLPGVASELFADRARLATPDFELDDASGRSVKEICVLLEGMPLAIELAAAQVRNLGLTNLSRRLGGHLPDLASRSTVGPERQRTLRHAMRWSYDLLSNAQQVAWRRLSVFSGGFTLEAAEQVAGGTPIETADIGDLLADLVDQSMLIFQPEADRYRLLEALREFAHERLREAGEEVLVAERHRRWMVGLTVDCDARWFGFEQAEVVDRLHAEAGNLRAALENCRKTDAVADGLRLANGGVWYWLTRASLEEGLRWFRCFLGRSDDAVLEAGAHWRAGYLATIHHDYPEARRYLMRASELAATADDPLDRIYAHGVLGLETLYEHPEEGEEARRLCREMFDDPAGDARARQWAMIGYGLASLVLGDLEECRRASLAGAEIGREVGEFWGRELSLRNLAQAEWKLGRPDAAEAALRDCLIIDRRTDDLWHMAWSMEALGWVAVDTGRFERGAQLLGIAEVLWAQSGSRLADPLQAWHATAVERLRERLGAPRLSAEIETGRSFSRADGLAFALEETGAGVEVHTGEHQLLSERELEVVALVASGLANRAIAEKLFLSSRTVEKHVEHAMDKLGLGSRAEIAAWYARQTLPTLPTANR
jgi:predicted ATPase/DNA-binding CsgD family transcriptional regulator